MLRMMKGAALALLLAAPGAASAQNVVCSTAHEDYREAIDKIQEAMRPYARCISESNGRNNCALEFKQLERAQKKFDEAVLQIGFVCRPERSSRSGAEG